MNAFLEKIDVNSRNISWSEYPFNLPEENYNEDIDCDSDWRKLLHEN